MDLCIAGLGTVGKPLHETIKDYWPTTVYDPPKGLTPDIAHCGVVFVSVPVPNDELGNQDLSIIKSLLPLTGEKAIIFIRSTVLPGTCDALAKDFKREIYSMPELLTARTAMADFQRLPILCGGGHLILKLIFPQKPIVRVTNKEAEMSKIFHNMVGVFKVHLSNMVYKICQDYGINYANLKQGILLSGYVNNVHLDVPGPDGKLGWGGLCFEPNTVAFRSMFDGKESELLSLMIETNQHYRNPETCAIMESNKEN